MGHAIQNLMYMSQDDNHMFLFDSIIVEGFYSFIHQSFSFMRVFICIGRVVSLMSRDCRV